VEAIAAGLDARAGDAQAVVLAQASMAPVAERCGGLSIPILSSPRLGVEAAAAAFRATAPTIASNPNFFDPAGSIA
jgi:hypothetical protein